LCSAAGIVFFSENDGSIGWIIKGARLIQYADGLYAVSEYEGSVVFMRYKEGEI
jgi:hypothetical protein